MIIKDTLARPLDKIIEEIIKVDQVDEQTVYDEIQEYVPTDSIKKHYRDLFKAIADAPSNPHEGNGIWISGFFGSGKSFFAKNLGYVLSNKMVVGKPFIEHFKQRIDDAVINDLIDSITTRISTEVVMFDISADKTVKKGGQGMAEIMYKVLLSQLDYADDDFDIAELEIELEDKGILDEFKAVFEREHKEAWEKGRKRATKFATASATLHCMDSKTYPEVNTWSESIKGHPADISVKGIVERSFELMKRRRPGKALAFVIDEVGQYVARSADKIENLRAVVEQFGRVGKNKVKAGEAPAPVWIVVTSQEKLDDVVSAIDDKRLELAKLQDRFKYRADLKPTDIREVVSKRVLLKKNEAIPHLKKLYQKIQGKLNASCKLERTTRLTDVNESDFVQFYPYLPHYIDLSIQIMSGIRLQPGAPRHYGGSNRTIIKQAYEMMINERTKMAEKEVGALVSLDLIYELVESNIATEKQMDINDITMRYKKDPDGSWIIRTAKVICLLEFVRDLPRTEKNIAAMLVNHVDQSAPLKEVKDALAKLEDSQFIRNTEEGYKLQTKGEKNWQEERGKIEIKPRDRNNITRGIITDILKDNKLLKYQYKNLKTFSVGIDIEGEKVEDGQIPLFIRISDDEETYGKKCDETRMESREKSSQENVYWIFSSNSDIDTLIRKVFASEQMINIYESLKGQQKITQEELVFLADEKIELSRIKTRLQEKMKSAMTNGCGIFQGVGKDASDLGTHLPDIIRGLLSYSVPILYPKLELGAKKMNGKEAEDVLVIDNLKTLPAIFHGPPDGLQLIIKDGSKYITNPNAEIAQEIFNHIKSQSDYGNVVTGKSIESYFGGVGYGWDRDLLRMVLAVLFRSGSIEVTHKGQRYSDYSLPDARAPFIKDADFKNASFVPQKPIEHKTLKNAAEHYQELTGKEVDLEANAISRAAKDFAQNEKDELVDICALAKAHDLPFSEDLDAYRETIESILSSSQEDCVKRFADEGKTLKEKHEWFDKIKNSVSKKNLDRLVKARNIVHITWSSLESRGELDLKEEADQLKKILDSSDLLEEVEMKAISSISKKIGDKYKKLFSELHKKRQAVYEAAIEEIRGRSEFTEIDAESQRDLMSVLSSKLCDDMSLLDGEIQCNNCRASIGQVESDIDAVDKHKADTIAKLQKMVLPAQKIERVRISKFFDGTIKNEDDMNEALEKLRSEIMKLIAEGNTIIVE